ncbi:cas scaffolding protein family member 4 isoform X2 [Bombina bombina]|uniref:cas scaffolding protein family member 4 isoform X2 n=1 Tax=Bombina bombina TaxID=8345 RepID=UPI00235B08F2|nr:cas scaffolding protein family member 4 isoform X2 [Bombina bombina]
MKVSNMLAKALYDNKAECSDELAFRKGDILTVLEQNIFGSEGWWRCYLHGRQGLAPANRLQLFTINQNDFPLTGSPCGSLRRQPKQQNIYQVPSASKTTTLSTYEDMDSIYITPSSLNVSGETYQSPVSLSAQILYDKAHSSSNQHLLTLPRASRATSVIHQELYDIPPSKHFSKGSTTPVSGSSPVFTTPEQTQQQQQIYDIPASHDSPGRANLKYPKPTNVYDVPPTGLFHHKDGHDSTPLSSHFNTLPNPRKSEWIYDIPVSPETKYQKSPCRKFSVDRQLVYDIPPARYGCGVIQESCQIYDVPPLQRNVSIADQTVYDVPVSHDMISVQQNGSSRKCSLGFLQQKREQNNSKDNVYDIPRGPAAVTLPKSESTSPVCDERIYDVPPPLPRNFKPSIDFLEQDRLSVSSSESRTSTLSTASTTSSDSIILSSPEDSIKEVTLELEAAVKRLTQLQERVSSSIASLMIFVSSKWRLQEHMETNIEEIHRAVDSIVSSLGMFIDFSQSIKASACNLTDNNIQLNINKQLQILTDSSLTLSCNREAISRCNWSLQALVINKPLSTPDDLDRFVMVARTIPDDIKRFVSIIIANGKLLFRKQEEVKKCNLQNEQKTARKLQMPARTEAKVLHGHTSLAKAGEKSKERKYPLTRQTAKEDSDYVHLQKKEEFEKMLKSSNQQLQNKTSPEEKRKGWLKPDPIIAVCKEQENNTDIVLTKEPAPSEKEDNLQGAEPTKKIPLSEHCHLYFGALQKAIGVFNNSLSSNQPPEVFITHGKLIIMVGQKLVDYLCQDVKGNDARSNILHKSSELCSLLKNLAMATKTAAIQYPNTDTMRELQKRINELSNNIQIFRSMVE